MSDRIAVMRAGRIAQLGAPREIYDRPTSRFVADFIGDTNILEGRAEGTTLHLEGWSSPLPEAASGATAIALRPERVRLGPPGAGLADARVEEANFLGDAVLLKLALPGGVTLLARAPRETDPALMVPDATASVAWRAEDPVPLAPE